MRLAVSTDTNNMHLTTVCLKAWRLLSKQQQDSSVSTFGSNTNSAAHTTVKSQSELGLTPVMKSIIKCSLFNAIQAMTKDNEYSYQNS